MKGWTWVACRTFAISYVPKVFIIVKECIQLIVILLIYLLIAGTHLGADCCVTQKYYQHLHCSLFYYYLAILPESSFVLLHILLFIKVMNIFYWCFNFYLFTSCVKPKMFLTFCLFVCWSICEILKNQNIVQVLLQKMQICACIVSEGPFLLLGKNTWQCWIWAVCHVQCDLN